MKPARLAVLGIAVIAAGGAALLVSRARQPVIVQEAAPVKVAPTARVLVASGDLGIGQTVKENDVDWLAWPKEGINAQFIQDNGGPNAKADVIGSIVRTPFVQGEPIRADKLIKGGNSGFMSAILPAGKRAVAIAIDRTGSSTAGGFILPNDHVDVIRTYRDEEASHTAGADVQVSETIISNVRVLAIGQNIQEKNGEKVITGENATLELDPRQAELVVLASKVQGGNLSLALRSMVDSGPSDTVPTPDRDTGTTVIRYGVATQALKK